MERGWWEGRTEVHIYIGPVVRALVIKPPSSLPEPLLIALAERSRHATVQAEGGRYLRSSKDTEMLTISKFPDKDYRSEQKSLMKESTLMRQPIHHKAYKGEMESRFLKFRKKTTRKKKKSLLLEGRKHVLFFIIVFFLIFFSVSTWPHE